MMLIFGAAGQLGRELCRQAGGAGVPYWGASREEVDITQGEQVSACIMRHKPAVVVNAAAYTRVDDAEHDREAAFAVNAMAPGLVAQACEPIGCPFLHISTDYVFDGKKSGPYIEDDIVAPRSVYGQSKAAGEAAIRAVASRHVILRTSWVYSAFGRNFVKTMLALARVRREISVVADQRGSPTSARDLAGAILAVHRALAGGTPKFGTFHFAGTGVATWHELAEHVIALQAESTGWRPAVRAIATEAYPTAAIRPRNSVLSSDRFFSSFGFRAEHWREGVRRVVAELSAPSAA